MHFRLRLRSWALSLSLAFAVAALAPVPSSLLPGTNLPALDGGPAAIAEPTSHLSASGSDPDVEMAVPPLSPEPYLALLQARMAMSRGDQAGARTALAQASRLDPGLVEPHLFAAHLALPWAIADAGDALFAAYRTAAARFAFQAQALAGGIWWALAALAALITLLAVGHASVAVHPVHHLLAERFVPALTPRLAAVAAGLVLILPLVLGAGPLASALAVLVIAVPLGWRPMALTVVGAGLILVLGVAPYVAPAVLRPADFGDQAQVLDYADHAPLTAGMSARLERMAGSGTDLALLVHANALQRAHRFEEAEPLLTEFCGRQPSDFRGPLSIGNALMHLGDTRTAVRYYRQAQALAPTAPEPLLNMALAYSQLMQFEMANEALAAASQIDPEAVAAITSANASGAAAPVEAGLEAAEMWRLFKTERAGLGADPPASVRLWLPWRGSLLWPLGVVLLGVAWQLRRSLARRPLPGPCAACGRMVCSRCAAPRPGLSLCRPCRNRIGDVPAEDALQRLIAVERQQRRGRERVSRIVWNLLVPGHGLVQAGRHMAATLLYAIIAVTGVAFLTGGQTIVPLPAAPANPGSLVGPAGYGLMLALALGVTALFGISARPNLGRATRGRLVPLDRQHAPAPREPGRPASSPTHRSAGRREWEADDRIDRRTGTDD